MAKYKIIPSSRTIVQSPISIGHKAEKGVQAIEFDLTAWVETYGSGTLTVIMRRWGDAIPYPIALEIDENNKATWTPSDIDTAKAGMAYAQLSYIVGETVVKKSDIYTFRVMDSLTGEGEPPEAYESWLEHLQHLAAEAMAEVLDIEGVVTDKTLTVDGGIADAKTVGDALAEKVDAADYSELSARVGRNTIALAEKADRSTTYTKTEVDALIESVDVETDTTLSVSGKPADAKKTGDEISAIKAALNQIGSAILACVDNIAWVNENGQQYYDALADAIGETQYPKLIASYTPDTHTVYETESVDTLKPYLTVVYYASASSEGETVTNYSLSGNISEGSNVVMVSYLGASTRIIVNAVKVNRVTGSFISETSFAYRSTNLLSYYHTGGETNRVSYSLTGSGDNAPIPHGAGTPTEQLVLYPLHLPSTASKFVVLTHDDDVGVLAYFASYINSAWTRKTDATGSYQYNHYERNISDINDGTVYVVISFRNINNDSEIQNVDMSDFVIGWV